MSEKSKTEKDVADALFDGRPLPEGTIYSPYNQAAQGGDPLPEGVSVDELVERARGFPPSESPHAQKASRTKQETKSES